MHNFSFWFLSVSVYILKFSATVTNIKGLYLLFNFFILVYFLVCLLSLFLCFLQTRRRRGPLGPEAPGLRTTRGNGFTVFAVFTVSTVSRLTSSAPRNERTHPPPHTLTPQTLKPTLFHHPLSSCCYEAVERGEGQARGGAPSRAAGPRNPWFYRSLDVPTVIVVGLPARFSSNEDAFFEGVFQTETPTTASHPFLFGRKRKERKLSTETS